MKSIIIRNCIHIIPNKIKFGKKYRETIHELKKTEKMSVDEINQYQLDKTRNLLIYAYENTVYYKSLFNKINFNPYTFHSFIQMNRIPYLTKDIVRKHKDELISCQYKNKKLSCLSTSGTTGEPASFYSYPRENGAIEAAFVRNAWNRIGYDGRGVTAVLRGEKIKTKPDKNIYWIHPSVYFKDVYSSYEMDSSNVDYYIEHIKKRKTRWIMAFPSSLKRLCLLALEKELYPVHTVKGILLSSEVIHSYQMDTIKQFFPNAKFSLIYGHTERACFAANCEHSNYYHFQKEYGYTEFVDLGNDKYEIIATGFNNHAMPLIRYRTGDLLSKDQITECSCDLPYSVMKTIGGRENSCIVTRSGHRISETAFIASVHSKAFDVIDKMQFEQHSPGECLLRIKPLNGFRTEDINELKSLIFERLNKDVEITINVVDYIPTNKNGKNQLIIQHIDNLN